MKVGIVGTIKADGIKRLIKKKGSTGDIMDAIMQADKGNERFTKDFSEELKKLAPYDACREIWDILKKRINYRIDPPGVQIVQSPGALWERGEGDCKSFSLFAASILKNLGIPYCYRFTGYGGDFDYRHVYVVAFLPDPVIIDGVYTAFDREKKYAFKKDIMPTRIEYIGAIPAADDHIRVDLGTGDIANLKAGQFYALLEVDRLNENVRRAKAFGDTKAQNGFQAMSNAMQILLAEQGIGCQCSRIVPVENVEIAGFFDWIKKAADKVKDIAEDVAGTALKVLSAPARLLVKGLLELVLPKAAPFFLYLYAPSAAVAKLNEKGQRKRKKAEKIRDFITKVIGMKGEHFDAIVKAGIEKRLGKSIDQIFAPMIASIGAIPFAAASVIAQDGKGIVAALADLLQKLFSVFGKKQDEGFSENDLPSEDDFYAANTGGSTGGTSNGSEKSGNTGLILLGAAALAIVALSGKGGKKRK